MQQLTQLCSCITGITEAAAFWRLWHPLIRGELSSSVCQSAVVGNICEVPIHVNSPCQERVLRMGRTPLQLLTSIHYGVSTLQPHRASSDPIIKTRDCIKILTSQKICQIGMQIVVFEVPETKLHIVFIIHCNANTMRCVFEIVYVTPHKIYNRKMRRLLCDSVLPISLNSRLPRAGYGKNTVG